MEATVGAVIGHIQTDSFCEHCGYNLNTQAVMRDERLNILVCRCPECGRFAAAGKSTSARQVWLNRFGVALLITWVIFMLWLMGMLTLFHGMIAYGHASDAVQFQTNIPATMPTVAFKRVYYYYVLREPATTDDERSEERVEQVMTGVIAVFLGMLSGGVVTVCMWHTRGWRRLVAFIPAIVGVGIALLSWISNPMYRFVRDVACNRMGTQFALECCGVVIGLWLGRPFARASLGIMLPPKLRQHLSFLWTTDGRQLKL